MPRGTGCLFPSPKNVASTAVALRLAQRCGVYAASMPSPRNCAVLARTSTRLALVVTPLILAGCPSNTPPPEAPAAAVETSMPAPEATRGDRCDEARLWVDGAPGAGSVGVDADALATMLAQQSGLDRLNTLQQIAQAGPAAAALAPQLEAQLGAASDDRIAAATARAWMEVGGLDDPSAAARMLDPATAMPVRYEIAGSFGRAGRVQPLLDALSAGGSVTHAAERGLILARTRPALLRDSLFGAGAPCATELTRDVCVEAARDLLAWDETALDPTASAAHALLVAEQQLLSGAPAAAAWQAAAGRVPPEALDLVSDSMRRLASAGLGSAAAPLAPVVIAATELSERERRIAAYLAIVHLPLTATPTAALLAGEPDALALAAAGALGTFRQEQQLWSVDDAAEVARAASDPLSAILVAAIARSGAAEQAQALASERFPDGFAAMIAAYNVPDRAEALVPFLTMGTDDTLAGDAFAGAAVVDAIGWKQALLASTAGSPARRATLAYRLGIDNPDVVRAMGEALDTLPSAEVAAWLGRSGVGELLTPLVVAALPSAHVPERRHAAALVSLLQLDVPTELLWESLVMPMGARGMELRDTRIAPFTALIDLGAYDLDTVLAFRARALEAGVANYETAALLDRALRQHCTE